MLDLTKPVRFKQNKRTEVLSVHNSAQLGRMIVEFRNTGEHLQIGWAEDFELENIPEPKVKERIMAVYKNNEGDFFFSEWVPGCIFQKVKITYTEGADSPWQIEEVK